MNPVSANNLVGSDAHERLVKNTRTWVAQSFYGTLLKQMRQSPFRDKLFGGGRGGEAFGSLFDQHVAEHMGRGVGTKLVNSIVRKIESAHASDRAAK